MPGVLPETPEGTAPVRWGQLRFFAGLLVGAVVTAAGAGAAWANLNTRVTRLEETAVHCARAETWARECRVNVGLIAEKLGVTPVTVE